MQGAATAPTADRARRREVVDAFLAASREGNFDALLALLDPDVVLRLDRGAVPRGASKAVRGAAAVAGLGFRFSGSGWVAQPALVNGAPGLVVRLRGRPMSVVGFTVRGGKIVGIDMLADPVRIDKLDLPALDV